MKLAQIRMKLGIPDGQEFSFYKSSMFQGVLMEWISTEYAEKLHTGGWNPYAQYIKKIQNEWYWIVSIFNEEAYQEIVPVILSEEKNEIYLKRDHLTIPIIEKKIEEIDTNDLLNQFYFKDAPRTIRIRFITPTAFKQNGQYLFMPDIGCILQSMIHKYDAVTTNTGSIDEKILGELKQNLRIQQYNLRSCNFHLEGVRIPAFIGEIKFGCSGSQTLVNYIHFLFHFACYSGIGIKASLGMGAIEVIE